MIDMMAYSPNSYAPVLYEVKCNLIRALSTCIEIVEMNEP